MINSIDDYYYDDQDEDGFLTEDDCNDFDPSIHPMAVEICNGYDDNCNGLVDEAGIVYFNDFDQDGFGDPSDMIEACEVPEGYIQDSSDCDDANPDIQPEAEEVCDDQVDNNCNSSIDLEDEACQ